MRISVKDNCTKILSGTGVLLDRTKNTASVDATRLISSAGSVIGKIGNMPSDISKKVEKGLFLRIAEDLVILILLLAAFGTFCSTRSVMTGHAFGSIFLPLFLVCGVFFAVCELYRCNRLAAFISVMLIMSGIFTQTVFACLSAEEAESSLFSLVVFMAVGLCASIAFNFLIFPIIISSGRDTAIRLLLVFQAFLYTVLLFCPTVNGARCWLYIGPVSLQLTELTKLAAFICIALICTHDDEKSVTKLFFAVLIINTVGLFLANELGTLIMIFAVAFISAFIFIPSFKKTLFMLFAVLIPAAAAMLLCWISYIAVQKNIAAPLFALPAKIFEKVAFRFVGFFDPTLSDANYQVNCALDSIRLGGWFGTNFHNYVPFQESDFIFSFIIEAMGSVFAVFVLAVMILFLAIIFKSAIYKTAFGDEISACTSVGFCFALGMIIQNIVNCFMAAGLLPTVGIPLYLFSSGGSSLMAAFTMLMFCVFSTSNNETGYCDEN